MVLPLALILALGISANPPGLANLDLSAGKWTHWEGAGFTIVPLGGAPNAASSADRAESQGVGLVHRTFFIPANTSFIQFSAAVYRPEGVDAEGTLDVVLEAARREYLPRQALQGDKWVPAPALLPPGEGRLRRYRWNVQGQEGKRVRIALIDQDPRPGCHLVCADFRLLSRDEINARAFADDMARLRLGKVYRSDSKHFMAFGNADPDYTEYRLSNCETIYPAFLAHFRKRGFNLTTPAEKLMVAIFDAQEGLEAYIGEKMPTAVTGLYHPKSNRLVVYDYARNRDFVAGKKRLEDATKLGSDLERERRIVTFGRWVRDHRDDTNISTVMHEVAHQLSYNTGMLDRTGDVPVWLAEGLAVYCESTISGSWQGIGEPNPYRAGVLAQTLEAKKGFIPLRELVEGDRWIRGKTTVDRILLGYSQSWALFRLLVEERPRQLKSYLRLIQSRKAAEQRLGDFVEAFGDVRKLDKRYQEYLGELARKEARKANR